MNKPFISIVDYGLGNLFSVKQACKKAGLDSMVTSSRDDILNSSAVILTGVGAFGKAMGVLSDKGLIDVLRDYALSGKPLLGICLGMQLLMTESNEFGRHTGLNIIAGKIERLQATIRGDEKLKVPLIGWQEIALETGNINPHGNRAAVDSWKGTLLEGIHAGAQMYFVHSYFVEPVEKKTILSRTRYGINDFCSGMRFGNIYGFQFHPECSGICGLKIYANLAKMVLLEKERGTVWLRKD